MSGKKIAIVTGGSSGIGKAVCRTLCSNGCKVYEFSRRECESERRIIHICTDVSSDSSVDSAVSQVLKAEGRVDILVNCAGFGISGAVEFTETEDAIRQMDVNFFGMVRVTKAVLTSMRKAGRGRIVNISSVAGPIPIPFQAFYSASKAAINDYTLALSNEVKAYGVSVCAIMPGDIASGFTDARKKSIAGDDEYGGRISKSVQVMEHDEQTGMSPDTAGRYIASIALKEHVKPLYAIGFVYKLFSVLIRILPCRLSNWILGLLYGGN